MPTPDDFRDALALIEATHRRDVEGLAVLLEFCDIEGAAKALAIIGAGLVGDMAVAFDRPPGELYRLLRDHQGDV